MPLLGTALVDNGVRVKFLGLCPSMEVSNKLEAAVGMDFATTFLPTLAACAGWALEHAILIPFDIGFLRILAFILVIAPWVQFTDRVVRKTIPVLCPVLGLFVPLIVTNCAILGRAEAFVFRQPVPPSLPDGLTMGLGVTAGLVLPGAMREVLGAGTVFAILSLLLGEGLRNLETLVIADHEGFLLMALPPGGFFALGFPVAGKRIVDSKLAAGKAAATGRGGAGGGLMSRFRNEHGRFQS